MSGKIRDIEINDYSVTRLSRSIVRLQKGVKKSLAIGL
jgi:hypothetical protein